MVLELNDREREVLKLALQTFDDELKAEKGRTDKKVYREGLRGEVQVVEGLLRKVA